MGYFSWKTAGDQGKSIRVGSRAFLLQPDGRPAIEEPSYDGYGEFGGVDAYVWLARENLPKEILAGADHEDLRDFGIALDGGSVYRDTVSGEIWCVYHDRRALVGGRYFSGRYSDVSDAWGMSPNDALEAGRLVEIPISDLVPVHRPLKFAFSADAVYEDLPASLNCDRQGWF